MLAKSTLDESDWRLGRLRDGQLACRPNYSEEQTQSRDATDDSSRLCLPC